MSQQPVHLFLCMLHVFFFQIQNWFSFPLPIRKSELSRSMPEAHSVSVALAASFKWWMMRKGSHVNVLLQSNSEGSKPRVNVSQVIKISSLQKISVWHWWLFLALLSCWMKYLSVSCNNSPMSSLDVFPFSWILIEMKEGWSWECVHGILWSESPLPFSHQLPIVFPLFQQILGAGRSGALYKEFGGCLLAEYCSLVPLANFYLPMEKTTWINSMFKNQGSFGMF